jgi:hypothetical protein
MNRILELEDKMAERLERILAALSSDPSRIPKTQATIPLPAPASTPIPETILSARPAAINQSEVLDKKGPFYQITVVAEQRLEPALISSFEDPANDSEGEPSIPVEHTTAAQKLLMWPSIKRLLSSEYEEDCVMRLEEERGLISVYGQGEISCTADDTQLPTLPLTRDWGGLLETNPTWMKRQECRVAQMRLQKSTALVC